MAQSLFIDKTTGTFSDSLLAWGLATVVQDVLGRATVHGVSPVHLRDHGAVFRLDFAPALTDELLNAVSVPYAPSVIIRTKKNAKSLSEDLPPQAVVDYEGERDKRAEYFKILQGLSREARQALRNGDGHPAVEQLQAFEPHPDWDVFRALNPANLVGYNKLMEQWWQVQDHLADVLALMRNLFAATPNDVESAVKAWKKLDKACGWKIGATATAAQVYNPSQGKGQNRAKADRLVMDNIKGAFWLVEWLKAVGFYRGAMTRQLRGVKDRKTYVVIPTEIDYPEARQIMDDFQSRMTRSETPVRSDILASLRYTQAMLEFSQHRSNASLMNRLFAHGRPSRIVGGFQAAFYKDLGNATATMNMSLIRLPAWLVVKDESSLAHALDVLAEHESIIRQFDESHSDAYALLQTYRDFLSGDDIRVFLEFAVSYSAYIIGQRERSGGRARQFTTHNLGRLIMNSQNGPQLGKILKTEGFQNIAYAIRQSTVVAQYRKQQGDRRYDVRYGLGQQLARKGAYPEEFLAELSDFLTKFNAENAQVMESHHGPYRRSIRTSDIDDIVALIDEFGDSQLICNLLVAYGYARTPRNEDEGTESDVAQS